MRARRLFYKASSSAPAAAVVLAQSRFRCRSERRVSLQLLLAALVTTSFQGCCVELCRFCCRCCCCHFCPTRFYLIHARHSTAGCVHQFFSNPAANLSSHPVRCCVHLTVVCVTVAIYAGLNVTCFCRPKMLCRTVLFHLQVLSTALTETDSLDPYQYLNTWLHL